MYPVDYHSFWIRLRCRKSSSMSLVTPEWAPRIKNQAQVKRRESGIASDCQHHCQQKKKHGRIRGRLRPVLGRHALCNARKMVKIKPKPKPRIQNHTLLGQQHLEIVALLLRRTGPSEPVQWHRHHDQPVRTEQPVPTNENTQ